MLFAKLGLIGDELLPLGVALLKDDSPLVRFVAGYVFVGVMTSPSHADDTTSDSVDVELLFTVLDVMFHEEAQVVEAELLPYVGGKVVGVAVTHVVELVPLTAGRVVGASSSQVVYVDV